MNHVSKSTSAVYDMAKCPGEKKLGTWAQISQNYSTNDYEATFDSGEEPEWE